MESSVVGGYFFPKIFIVNTTSNLIFIFLIIETQYVYSESVYKKCLAWDKGKITKMKYDWKDTILSTGWNLICGILRSNKANSKFL